MRNHSRNRAVRRALAIASIGAAQVALCDSVTLLASRDNTLYESAAGDLSNGAGQHIFAGLSNRGELRRGLVAFDLDGAIPPGSTIAAATVRLFMSRTGTQTATFGLHRVLADWGEGTSDAPDEEGLGTAATPGDATWLHRFYDTEFWTTPGGDFAPGPSAAQSIFAEGDYEWASTPQLVADVQSWLDQPDQSFGWAVVGDETIPSSKRFDSRETGATGLGPRLIVEFTPPAPCFGDLDGDHSVGLSDLTLLLSDYGASGLPEPIPADLDHDGDVDLTDLSALLSRFGTTCSP